MVTTTRRRSEYLYGIRGNSHTSSGDVPTVFTVTGVQKTVSSGHNYKLIGKTDEDIGGSFLTTRNHYYPTRVLTNVPWSKSGIFAGTYGHGWAVPAAVSFGATDSLAVPSSDVALDAIGTTAISRVNPMKPTFDGAVNAAELLREGIPKAIGSSLLKSHLRDFRKLGDEYLNFQFGWMPLISGLKDLAKAVIQSEKIISQLYRDNGRNVRRRYQFPDVKTFTSTSVANTLPFTGSIDPNEVTISRGTLTTETRVVTQRWFSGCFTYYIPMGSSDVERLQRMAVEARKLYGIRLTPDVLWNLAPWSWAADWFANTGDIMSNLSTFSQDGLVMRYGYMMEKVSVNRTHSLPCTVGKPVVLKQTYGSTTKSRRPATPYGFGLSFEAFSAYQLGIIGALGISNVPKGRSRS